MTNQDGHKIDMLHGPMLVKVLVFALPLALSSILQQMFNSVDVAVVGHFVGASALAAVGSNGPVIGLFINLLAGLSLGTNAVVSNHIGRHDPYRTRRAVATSMRVAVIGGVSIAVLGFASARSILELMGTPDDVMEQAVLYLRCFMLGVPFLSIFNFGASILRSVGDTRRPLYILVCSGVLNAALNVVFVVWMHWGVEGVAVATSIANLVSAAAIVVLLLREKGPCGLHLDELKSDFAELGGIVRIGLPAGVQGMVFSFSNMVLQSAVNSYGSEVMAGSAAALNFEYYCFFVIQAFNGAAISFIGQNYGAGNMERVRRAYGICMLLGVVFCASLNWLFIWQEELFLGVFTSEPGVMAYGFQRMHIVLGFQALGCSYEITAAALRGMGRSIAPTVFTIIGTCFLRVGWVYFVMPDHPGFANLMMVYPISWILTGLMVISDYFVFMKKKSCKYFAEEQNIC
ncbi:MAG: MATE family efflux transporter [Muribaculaceae bacterium]